MMDALLLLFPVLLILLLLLIATTSMMPPVIASTMRTLASVMALENTVYRMKPRPPTPSLRPAERQPVKGDDGEIPRVGRWSLLTFPEKVVASLPWQVGTRLVTVNTYRPMEEGLAPDVVLGTEHTGSWGDFSPYVADLLTDDREALEIHKSRIAEAQWGRCAELGRDALARGTPPRDGRPLWSGSPAGMPGYWWSKRAAPQDRRGRWGPRVAVALALYVSFAAACIAMEWYARQRFTVPSKADVMAAAKGAQRLQIERARIWALGQRDVWLPYRAYATAMDVLMGVALITGLGGFPLLWRNGFRSPKAIAVGGMLIWILPVALVMAPPILAESKLESVRSSPAAIQALLAATQTKPRAKASAPPAGASPWRMLRCLGSNDRSMVHAHGALRRRHSEPEPPSTRGGRRGALPRGAARHDGA